MQENVEYDYVVRAEKYSLPADLNDHILGVFKVTDFPLLQNRRRGHITPFPRTRTRTHSSTEVEESEVDMSVERKLSTGSVTLQLIKSLYKITSSSGHESASQAVYQTIGQTVSKADLITFLNDFGVYNMSVVDHIRNIGGHYIKGGCPADKINMCGEANLDIQWPIHMH
jgi:hypothetical protein